MRGLPTKRHGQGHLELIPEARLEPEELQSMKTELLFMQQQLAQAMGLCRYVAVKWYIHLLKCFPSLPATIVGANQLCLP